jgi:gliding motility-associated-like protein
MPKSYSYLILGLLLILFLPQSWATHNRAGEISVEQVGDCTSSLTVKATIVTYTKASSVRADRDSLTICWGDGNCDRVGRLNGPGNPPQGELLENDTKVNIYIAFHTFPARGTYAISMTDPNRNGGILNVNFPNSEQIKFHIQTTYTIPNPQFQGCNNTPILLQPPIDIGCVGETFTHNPNAYDADGDSLSYEFIVPKQEVGLDVANYQFPNMINPSPNNNLTIDAVTGDIVWDAPQKAGEYNLAMIIIEHRQGIPIDTVIRDMQILVVECENKPPTVEVPFEEICVIAGETISFDVIAGAPEFETAQKVKLTALGGPFEVPTSPASLVPPVGGFLDDPVIKRFTWVTNCDHISNQYYSVVFRAVDDFLGDSTGLATLKTVRIKVVGPPPEDVQASPGKGFVRISWEKPYFCEEASNEYFRGFTVWKRVGSNNFPIDTCTTGLEGKGYEQLTTIPIMDMEDGRYVYVDENVEQGRTYCYRILANFAKTTPGGRYTYNPVESLPSEEACVQLSRDLPIITKVNVLTTDAQNGLMEVCWTKPQPEDLDTTLNGGPYRFEILRAGGQVSDPSLFQPIGVEFESEYFANFRDTCFIDEQLNTQGESYSYIVQFYVNGDDLIGSTNPASSVFLNAGSTDRAVNLSWQAEVPWDNYEFTVYRKNAQGGFDSLATVNTPSYRDVGLVNGEEYCYRVLAKGTYGIDNIISPLLNFSQEQCAVPQDDIPPCAPILDVTNICDSNVGCSDENSLFNTLSWEVCPEDDDVAAYAIYYSPVEDGELTRVDFVSNPNISSIQHKPESGLAGCYAITALDALGNESELSNIICVDNCPNYSLPNAFTPNGDGQNDLFVPYPYCFIESVDFKVFNRWGQLVYETTNPDLNWDGTNLNGSMLPEGVYYYKCKIFEQRVSGTVEREDILSGFIQLVIGGG